MLIYDSIALAGSAQFGLSSPYDCHVYAVSGSEGVVLVDAGSGLGEAMIVANLERDFPGEEVVAILLTHAHADHSGGARSLAKRFGCDVAASSMTRSIIENGDEERSGLSRARSMGAYPAGLKLLPTPVSVEFSHGETVSLAGLAFEAIHVRGHSEDSFCFRLNLHGRQALFAGDVLFYGGVLGVINSSDSGMQGYCQDIARLSGCGIDMLLPAHGLFTLRNGQQHIDVAVQSCAKGFLPRQIGQGDMIF